MMPKDSRGVPWFFKTASDIDISELTRQLTHFGPKCSSLFSGFFWSLWLKMDTPLLKNVQSVERGAWSVERFPHAPRSTLHAPRSTLYAPRSPTHAPDAHSFSALHEVS